MTVTSEDEKTENIRSQAETANYEDEFGVVDLGRVNKPREGFEEDRYA